MLKPTSMLLIKPIAAVVWRWSLIFHTQLFRSFFYVHCFCFSFLSNLALPCHRKMRNHRNKNKFFHSKCFVSLQPESHESSEIDLDFIDDFFITFMIETRTYIKKGLPSFFSGKGNSWLMAHAAAMKSTFLDWFQQTNEKPFNVKNLETLSHLSHTGDESFAWRHRLRERNCCWVLKHFFCLYFFTFSIGGNGNGSLLCKSSRRGNHPELS